MKAKDIYLDEDTKDLIYIVKVDDNSVQVLKRLGTSGDYALYWERSKENIDQMKYLGSSAIQLSGLFYPAIKQVFEDKETENSSIFGDLSLLFAWIFLGGSEMRGPLDNLPPEVCDELENLVKSIKDKRRLNDA